jgi:ribosomal protein S18 acetylase RimI-like enzyme
MDEVLQHRVKIFPVSQEHIEGLHACLDSVARERKYLGMVEAPPLETVRSFVLSYLEIHAPQFVAVIDNEVIGWSDIHPGKREGFKHSGQLGMGVDKRYRRLGIGGKLITIAIQKAKECGLERLELGVFASNTAAIKLYEKTGFVVEGIKKKARKIDGGYDDMIEMALFI